VQSRAAANGREADSISFFNSAGLITIEPVEGTPSLRVLQYGPAGYTIGVGTLVYLVSRAGGCNPGLSAWFGVVFVLSSSVPGFITAWVVHQNAILAALQVGGVILVTVSVISLAEVVAFVVRRGGGGATSS